MSREWPRRRASVVVVDGDRLLLGHVRDPADPSREFLLLLGGAVEDGESPVAAAVREVHEELGLVASDGALRLLRSDAEERFTFGGRRYRQRNTIFALEAGAREIDAAQAPARDQHLVGLAWLSAAELESPPLPIEPPEVLDVLRSVLAARR